MDSAFRKSVTFTADKGVWLDDPMGGLRVPEGYAAAARDFFFWNGSAVSRPGVNDITIVEAGTILLCKSFVAGAIINPFSSLPSSLTTTLLCLASSYYTIAYNPVTQTYASTAITGPAFTTTTLYDSSMDFVNLELVVGGVRSAGATGLHRISGTAYLEIVGQPWFFVLGHGSRLFVAYKVGAGNGNWTVGWTVPGTNTNFTDFGSGLNVLADDYGLITGLLNIRDFVVIARGGGFTVAYPTNQSDPAYAFRNFNKSSHFGVKWPSTLAGDGLSCMFVGEDDVYSFDLSEIKAIGAPIKKPLLDAMLSISQYRGTIIRSTGRDRRKMYVLSPVYAAALTPTFIYDIGAQSWQTVYLNEDFRGGIFDLIDGSSNATPYGSMPAFFDSDKHMHVMQSDIACEVAPTLRFGPFQVSTVRNDYRVLSNYLSVIVEGVGGEVTLRVRATKGIFNEPQDSTFVETSAGQAEGSAPQRLIFRIDVVGNFFIFDLTFPASNTIRFDRFECEFAESGELR